MNRKTFFAAIISAGIAASTIPLFVSASINIKLPYESGQSFVVVQGYNSPPTHINKDLYAIDFSQNGCDAYGKFVVAANDGVVLLAEQSGYNGGYGTQVLVVNGNQIVTRYAHMIPGSIPAGIVNGAAVVQGEPLGEVGNTGLVAGAACPIHPGTHIHFAMYSENTDGSFAPYRPEPISNYVGIVAGKWYLSDNAIAIATIPGAVAIIDRAAQTLFGTASDRISLPTSGITSTISTNSPPEIFAQPGGVSVAQASLVIPSIPETSTASTPIATALFNSSTLAIDLSWPATLTSAASASNSASVISGTIPAATTTIYKIFSIGEATTTLIATTTATNFSYQLSGFDFNISLQFMITGLPDASGADSTIQTTSVALPNWWTVIQPVDDTNSNGSWYEDNWYDLGTGFYGEIRSLALEGFVDSSNHFASHLYLDEYLDGNYSQLNQTYLISNKAPFTDGLQKITITGLSIPLQPNKYYRLRTYQDYQNVSVILTGTTATGTAMRSEFILGTGRVETQYQFYPYLAAIMIPNYPPLMPPNAPLNMTVSFDSLNSIVNFSWPAATDPDTNSSLLTYQWNISTSTAFDPGQWHSIGKNLSASAPVIFGNSNTIGVRAVDDLGNIGEPLAEPWSFPADYTQTPEQLDHSVIWGGNGSPQKIILSGTTTINGIDLWVNGEQGGGWCCSYSVVSIHQDASGTPGVGIATSSEIQIGPYPSPIEVVYSFSTSPIFSPGIYWFSVDQGVPAHNATEVYGTSTEAYFRIEQ